MKLHALGILLFMALMAEPALAQQIPNFSLYNMNHYLVNPAATGTTDRMPVSLSYRKIWAGMTNAPSVQYLSSNARVAPDMGVGAKISIIRPDRFAKPDWKAPTATIWHWDQAKPGFHSDCLFRSISLT